MATCSPGSALVLIPQAMAYADLAELPPVHGLYAGAVAPILAAPFASSRYLQTGPTALTCLLTIGGLGPCSRRTLRPTWPPLRWRCWWG